MNTHAGYSKKTLTDTNVLLTGGGDKSLADFVGGIQYVSASHKILIKTAAANASWTDLVTLITTDENVKQVPKTDNVNRPLMMINGGTATGTLTSTSMFSTGIYANTSTNVITAGGFAKTGSDSYHILLGNGGHALLSELSKVANILKGSYKYTKSNPLTRTATKADDYSYYTDINFDAVLGETYVISCETDGNWVSHSGGRPATAKACGFWLYSDSDTHYSFGPDMPKVWTAPKTANYHIRINMYTSDNPYTLHFWNMKVERGVTATDWLICTDDPWHRALVADSVAWSGITSMPGALGSVTQPVYWNGSGFTLANSYPTKASWNYDDVYSKLGHKHPYTDLTGSGTTENQAILSNGTANGWKLAKVSLDGHNHNASYVTFVGVTDDNTNHKNLLRYVLNGTSNYFTVPYSTTSGTSDATYFLYARSSALESAGVQFIQGQVKTGSSDGLAYSGSSSNFKVLSFPPNATAINSQGTANESANVAIFRIAWGTTYWHDLHFSPNNNNIYHRVVFNSSPIDWRIVVETTGNKGNSTKPVYISGGLVYECDAYPTKASWNYDDKYVTAVGAGTGSYANQLYYTKNGSNTYFTVPYASNADKLDGWNNTKFCKVYTRAEIGETPNFDNLKDVDGNQVNGFFESRVNETTNATGKKPPYTSCAPMLSFLNQYVSLQLMGHSGEWYIRGGQSANIANANANINWERIVLNSGTWDINITGDANTLDGLHAVDLLTAASLGASGNSTTLSITVGGTTKTGSITVPYATNAGTADGAYLLKARSNITSGGVQYITGQIAFGTSANTAYWGSSSNFNLMSVPPGGTSDNNGKMANVAILRIDWGTSYWHDLHFSPNDLRIFHRSSFYGTANEWRLVVETPSNKGGSTTPVYVSGGLVYECTSYANASVNYANSAGSANSVAWTNVSSRPTKISLTGSVTGSVSLGAGDLTLDTTTNHSHSWSSITSKPCTLISYSRNTENINANTWRTKECSLIEIRNTELTYSNLAMSGYNSFFNFWTPDGIVCTLFLVGNGAFYYRSKLSGTPEITTSWYRLMDSNNCSVSKSGETLTVKINGTSESLTNTWRGILNNLTSTSTTDSLSAAQGKALNDKFGSYLPLAGGTMNNGSKIYWNKYGTSFIGEGIGDGADNTHYNIRIGSWYGVALTNTCPGGDRLDEDVPAWICNVRYGHTTLKGNCTAVNFYTTSDRNKKTNISSFSEHIRKFQLKDTEKYAYGVIALEVEEMFRDGEEGNMTVNYNSILSFYIGSLENKVKMLEERIKRLESK